MPKILHGYNRARIMGRRRFLSPRPKTILGRVSDRHGPRSFFLRRFSCDEPRLDQHALGGGNFRAARARNSAALSVPCLQHNTQPGSLDGCVLFALDNEKETAVALGRMAVTHRMRYSDPHDELFPNAVLMAFADTIRRRRTLVYTLAHGRQLHEHDHRLLRAILLPSPAGHDSRSSCAGALRIRAAESPMCKTGRSRRTYRA